jgi:hypothetical protein
VNTDLLYNVTVEPRSKNALGEGLNSLSSVQSRGSEAAQHPGKAKGTRK